MSEVNHSPDHEEIRRAMAFYEERGWDWLMVVSYLSAKATSHWPWPPGSYIKFPKEPKFKGSSAKSTSPQEG